MLAQRFHVALEERYRKAALGLRREAKGATRHKGEEEDLLGAHWDPKILHWCGLSCAKVSESSMKSPIRPVPRALKLALFSTLALVSLSGCSGPRRACASCRSLGTTAYWSLSSSRTGSPREVRAAVRSGLKTTFTYTVELRLEVPASVDRTIATAVLTNSVEYQDNLTRQHSVVRVLDGTVGDTQVTDSETLVRQLMTSFQRLPLFRDIGP